MDAAAISIDDLLARAVEAGASDLHLVPGAPPAVRVRGELTWFEDAEQDPVLPAGMTMKLWSRVRAYFEDEIPKHLRAPR